jgi:hypothetical protein
MQIASLKCLTKNYFYEKTVLLTMFLFVTAWWANAQISQGGFTPPSFKHGIYTDVDRVTLHPKDMKFIMDEELKLSKAVIYHTLAITWSAILT